MKFLVILLFFFLTTAYAQSPWYFGTGEAVNLTNGTKFANGIKNISGALNPTATAVNAPAGSMYFATTGIIYVKQDAGSTTNWTALGFGSGNVVGPASATSNAIPRFNLTTGKILKDSGVIISDAGVITSPVTNGDVTIQPNGSGLLQTASIRNIGRVTNALSQNIASTLGENSTLKLGVAKNMRLNNFGLLSVSLLETNYSGAIPPLGGQEITLVNVSGHSVTLNNLTGTATSTSKQINTGMGRNYTLAERASVSLVYNDQETVWEIIAPPTYSKLDLVYQTPNGPDSASWTTGNNATFLGAGTISGIFTDNTATPLQGSGSYKYTQAAGSLNDYVVSRTQAVPKRFRGNNAVVTFPYTYDGADNDMELIVYDVTNAAIINASVQKNIKATGATQGFFRMPIVIPATCLNIRFGFRTRVLNSGKIFEFASLEASSNVLADVDQSRIAGESYFAGVTSADCARTSTTAGAFTCNAALPAPTIVKSTMGAWSTTDANLLEQTITNLPAGTYKAKFIGEAIMGAGASSAWAINDGTTTCYSVSGTTTNASGTPFIIECTFTYTSAGDRSFELYGAASSSSINVTNSRTSPAAGTKFILEYFGSGSVYSSTNADTDWVSCGHTTASFTGFGTPTSIETQCKRDGGDLLMKGKFVTGTSTAVEARISLPVWSGAQLSSKGTSVIPSLQLVGDSVLGANSSSYFRNSVLIEPSVSYIVFGQQSATLNAMTKVTGSTGFGTGATTSFTARIPIEGWDSSNIIIGKFNGLESCADSTVCTSNFSAVISPAATTSWSSEGVNFIASCGNGSTGDVSCIYKTPIFTVVPSVGCTINAVDAGGTLSCAVTASSSTGFTVRTKYHLTSGATGPNPYLFTVFVNKAGVDAVASAKTALAVASDANVKSIGSVGVDVQQVYFGTGANCDTACTTGTCNICSRTGTKITSVSWVSAGTYNVNGLDGTKYDCFGTGSGAQYTVLRNTKSLSTSTYARVYAGYNTGVLDSAYNDLICIGTP